ncbi:MAG: dockerin type I repeat-containing protein, partial [candidate division Zixibacteria bacterium]|nr:dockerin type I repeat-containing protein [candidate division Zixibacteria bacterium]
MMGTCGPFTFNPGDSQYVLIKMAVGQGSDRLNSITKLKEVLNAPPYLGTTALMAVVRPEPQYYMYQNAIDPMMDTIFVGRIGGDPIGDVDLAGLRVNGDIVPTSVGLLPGHAGFLGEVLQIVFPAKPFIAGYGQLWGTTMQPFAITGGPTSAGQFTVNGTVRMIGHIPGDANGDMRVNVGDAVFLVSYAFRDGPGPVPEEVGDANGDGKANIGDAVYIIGYLFRGGPAPHRP